MLGMAQGVPSHAQVWPKYRKLAAGALMSCGNTCHDLSNMLTTAGPGDFAAGTAGGWTTHIYGSLFRKLFSMIHVEFTEP